MRDWNVTSELDELHAQGLWRELRPLEEVNGVIVKREGRELINFSSNDYLGLACSEELRQALVEGVSKYGGGSGASRLVCGTHRVHMDLEEALADFKRTEAALCFSSGFAVALGTIPALMGSGDTILLDKLCHASLVDAARLSGAVIRVFPHNHLEKLSRLLGTATGRVLIVTESIFSMDGDAAALREIVELKEKHGAWLLLDEAHAVGVLGPQGRGLAAALGLENRIELHMGTLSKSLGLSGGYLAASRQVIDLLINRARSFIYSTSPPPHVAHAAAKMLQLLRGEHGDSLRFRLRSNVTSLSQRMEAVGLSQQYTPAAGIVPFIVGDERAAVVVSERLFEAGYLVPAIRFPTVARGKARLRISPTALQPTQKVVGMFNIMLDIIKSSS
ncbi:MAG: 8-amino-7-oxononanoate synthase [Verrucomicrobiaceae bacterium]|nr:8-amino-7-oxononanoate synthase [Verrucomicrobiaceae bacterium]